MPSGFQPCYAVSVQEAGDRIAVIGSGPSGANAALTLLERGKRVILYDVGIVEAHPPEPDADFEALKERLADPQEYFLGRNFEALIPQDAQALLSLPPSRAYHLRPNDPRFGFQATPDFSPFHSLARGGLANGWSGLSLRWDEDDLRGMPVSAEDFRAASRKAQKRLPISGPDGDDDLSPYLSHADALGPPLEMNRHEALLYSLYQRTRTRIRTRRNVLMGHSRVAVDTRPGSEQACTYCNRCFWGCPRRSIYNPSTTLEECQTYRTFEYRPHALVSHFGGSDGQVRSLELFDTAERRWRSDPVGTAVLAAGALGTGGIFLRTLKNDASLRGHFATHELRTKSILDTLSVRIPYLLGPMIGRPESRRNFQFNKLLLGYVGPRPEGYPRFIQGQVLSLSSLLYHPLIRNVPLGTYFGSRLFFLLRSALGSITYYLPDAPHGANAMRLRADRDALLGDRMEITYENAADKLECIRTLVRATSGMLRDCRSLALSWQTELRPNGYGIHYGGTVPMSTREDVLCVNPEGRSYAYRNLVVADGATFPVLPSKSITYNLVVNAIRIAEAM